MTARQATAFDFEPRRGRLSPKTTLIVTLSLGVHAAAAAYLAMVQFAAPEPVVDESPVIATVIADPFKKPPPPPEEKPQPKTPALHPPISSVTPTVAPL